MLEALGQCLRAQMKTRVAFQQASRASEITGFFPFLFQKTHFFFSVYYFWCQFILLVRPEGTSQGSWSCSEGALADSSLHRESPAFTSLRVNKR